MQHLCKHVFRRYFTVLILFVLLENPINVSAEDPPPPNPPGPQKPCLSLEPNRKEGAGFLFKMDESLQIKATGMCFQAIKDQLESPEGSRGVKLLLDDVVMANLPMPRPEHVSANEVILSFHLKRNSQDDENRKAWDTLLGKQHGTYEFTLPITLVVGNKLAWRVESTSPFKVYIAKSEWVWGTLAVGVVIFLVVYYRLVKNPAALRDAPNGHYSLGKSQMAFWGLLVVLTFAGIWFLTDTMERIPPQVLILLGISGATGLSAIAIGENKKSNALTEIQSEIDKLKQEQQTLEKQKLTAEATFPPVSKARLEEIQKRLGELSQVAPSAQSAGFWRDICDDGNGMSFHRMQVVIWTVVLGIIFVDSVSKAISMPEFSETLLTLLGISNGTYLGFKIPEKA